MSGRIGKGSSSWWPPFLFDSPATKPLGRLMIEGGVSAKIVLGSEYLKVLYSSKGGSVRSRMT